MTEYTYSAEFANGSRATLKLGMDGMRIEWVPDVPRLKGQARRRFLAAYRVWRNDSIADFARRAGINVAVVDV